MNRNQSHGVEVEQKNNPFSPLTVIIRKETLFGG